MNRLVSTVLGLSLLAASAAHAQPGGGMRSPDADGDGVITAAEYEASALQRFERLDANKDGFIDAAEIEAIRQRFAQMGGGGGGGPSRMLTALAGQDADKDGKVSKDEALASSRAQFAAADKNGDGKLTSDEFRPGPPGGPPPRQ